MNELLQRHGCSNVFTLPEGLKELMCDISREVLREQPEKTFDFIANYLSVLLITREHGILAMKILEDLCDCKPSVSEHLMHLGMGRAEAETLAQVIKEEIEGFEPVQGKEKVKESQIVKKILARSVLDEDMAARVCQVARNAYRDYWYRKKLLEKSMTVKPDEPWEIAAQHTLELYKRTKPSFAELTRATQKIQAAYRGYHVRKNLLTHLKPKKKNMRPKVDLLGPPVDVAESREIDLGPIMDIKIREDDVNAMFDEYAGEKLGLSYDPMKTITHVKGPLTDITPTARTSRIISQVPGVRTEDVAESRIPIQLEARQSLSPGPNEELTKSRHSLAQDLHKISFVEAPPVFIPDSFEELIPDETQPVTEENAQDDLEVQEAQGIVPAKAVESEKATPAEVAQEVPEELPADKPNEGDASSAPTVSIPSSAPDTADNTDVEDAGETPVTTGDEAEE